MVISLKTEHDASIYTSEWVGPVKEIQSWAFGPRNFIRALKSLLVQKKRMKNAYGNISCGSSWLEINGTRLDVQDFELEDLLQNDNRASFEKLGLTAKTSVQKCKEFLASIENGKYQERLAQESKKVIRSFFEINQVGFDELKDFLAKNHKFPLEHFTPSMLAAIASKAEAMLANGEAPIVELHPSDVRLGGQTLLRFSNAAFDEYPLTA